MGALYRRNYSLFLQALALAAFLLFSNLAHAQDITSNLEFHYELEETTGTALSDSSPNANTATWGDTGNNNVSDNTTTGYIGDALSLTSGGGFYPNTQGPFNLEHTDAFTYGAWIYQNSVASLGGGSFFPLFLKGNTHGYGATIADLNSCPSNCITMALTDDDTQSISVRTGTISIGSWQHVAVTYDGSGTAGGINIYLDGVSQSLTVESSDSFTGTMTSADPFMVSTPFLSTDAIIDDVKFFTRELTPTDVATLAGGGGGGGGPVTCDAAYEAVMWYNADESVMQYCNGSDWISMGESTGSVAAPAPSAGLIGHWTMDDTVNTTAVDSAAGGNDGTMMGGLDAGTDSVPGQVGTAILMNGSSDYINVGDQSIFDFGTSDFSIGMWLKFDNTTTFTGYEEIISKGELASTDSYYIAKEESGGCRSIDFGLDDGGGLSSFNSPGCTFPWTDTDWHHIIITFDRDADATLYIDGVVNTTEDISGDSGHISNGMDLLIGAVDLGGITSELDGAIDDVRIYNQALTPAEVTDLYNAGASVVSTACTSPSGVAGEVDYNYTTAQMQYCNGSEWISMGPAIAEAGAENFTYTAPTANLTGHWTFDDAAGGTTVTDSAGSNDGTWVGGTIDSASGMVGTAFDLDGDNNWINLPDNNSISQNLSEFTVAMWVRPDTLPSATAYSQLFGLNENSGGPTASRIFVSFTTADQISVGVKAPDSAAASAVDTVPTLSAGVWQHVVATVDVANDTINVYFDGLPVATTGAVAFTNATTDNTTSDSGSIGAEEGDAGYGDFDGLMDDVRFYSSALSPAEVYSLYRATGGTDTGLVGHWKLDETSGSTITDSSPGGNDGTWVDGSGNSVAEETTNGPIGNALDFDGTDDGITIAVDYDLPVFTACTWFNVDATATGNLHLIDFYEDNNAGIHLRYDADTDELLIRDDTVGTDVDRYNTSVSKGAWHHACMGINELADVSLHIDGALINNSTSALDTINNLNTNLYIGQRGTGTETFFGMMDDTRLYNRALSTDEIEQLYLASGTVIEGGTWSPTTLSTPPILWFDATDSSSITHTVGAVSTWTDKINGRVASLDTGSTDPDYSTTQFEGNLPGIYFDGNTRMLGTLASAASGDAFIFLAQDHSGTSDGSGFGQAIGLNAGSQAWDNAQSFWIGDFGGSVQSRVHSQGGTNLNMTAWSSTGDILFGGVRSGADELVGAFNGALTLSTQAKSVDLNGTTSSFYIGGDAFDNNYQIIGTIGEIIVLNYEPSLSERQTIEGYLAHKWGLDGKLPGGHPYKSTPPDGSGAFTCSSPSGPAGEMLYNDDFNVMQYCNGSEWVSMGTAN